MTDKAARNPALDAYLTRCANDPFITGMSLIEIMNRSRAVIEKLRTSDPDNAIFKSQEFIAYRTLFNELWTKIFDGQQTPTQPVELFRHKL